MQDVQSGVYLRNIRCCGAVVVVVIVLMWFEVIDGHSTCFASYARWRIGWQIPNRMLYQPAAIDGDGQQHHSGGDVDVDVDVLRGNR